MAGPKTLTVIWGNPGVPCPMARKVKVINKAGVDITMIYGTPIDVPNSMYYRRAITKGDLAIVPKGELAVKPKPSPRRSAAATKTKAPQRGEES